MIISPLHAEPGVWSKKLHSKPSSNCRKFLNVIVAMPTCIARSRMARVARQEDQHYYNEESHASHIYSS